MQTLFAIAAQVTNDVDAGVTEGLRRGVSRSGIAFAEDAMHG